MNDVKYSKMFEREGVSFVALQLMRNLQGTLGALKLVTEGIGGNFTNWPRKLKDVQALLNQIREVANVQRLKAKFKEIGLPSTRATETEGGKSAE